MDIRPPATILQFSATIISDNKQDKLRSFVVQYYVEDKAFQVFEKVVPNSGFNGGKFITKTVCNNPETGKPFEPKDIFLGAKVNINGFRFILQEASEESLKIMESRPDVFVKADLSVIITKLRKVLAGKAPKILVEFQKHDTKKQFVVPLVDVQQVLEVFGIVMGDQEFLTLYRRYQFGKIDGFMYQDFCEAMA
ncbi:hypothetical protein TVAG_295210 [Trichomonas vaginalis G3]|uniref:DM10 domain-containing protein n=1 Tax=Trichomonas vaginalis (strain ATCC PRA-98 / G3) TaxID=412133 RepID=A2DL78_TRIV3|nr:alpha-tubulin binding [Trichomonas vaginalis G3]EAY18869.1 hypothetical protein TVAG_295210 [Trichomonas vaginalis G3]KAI5526012.1 alpha-tubulin binding [Trichomonas vaginalis G3]|eukprot:XP_001579855.1 hypothetical protein [Trichomonas vaginalis G3]